ncbi:thioredoxin-dependent thiol peroxidase [Aquisalinus flavus]|uniref:thioredoxin-dependent peroxiredoxin n=1 Tax=Aquisalinus flavus TaxID=1526572 RepID=A0A8J2Y4S9_9PROT|nr:thioredoxin-dependent thiol peroxidase [Aquisalinus flavus]MBD0427532.1 thioredoxin-dependent thiol peroxidase [Aquisalinus flavus]UNE47326.1 thioredoxin-dependent thiol peroxidase [Aquisalinus flavus]GGD01709.1 peroxiredoxin [Aquisalinus flavus]
MTKPETGDKAPDFSLARDDGKTVSLSDYAGRTLVLYFYPKDDTPGCTKQALGFTGRVKDFEEAGAVILGVSRDTVAKHEKFKQKHELGIDLASDPDGGTIEAYGSWVEKSMYGKKYMGIDRSTFLIDGKGMVREIWRKVKVPGHVDAVLEAARALS